MHTDDLSPLAPGEPCPRCGAVTGCTCRRSEVVAARVAMEVANDLVQRATRVSEVFHESPRTRPGGVESSLLVGQLATAFPDDTFRWVPYGETVRVVAQQVRRVGGPAVGAIAWLVADIRLARDLLAAACRAQEELGAEMAVVIVPTASDQLETLPRDCGDRVLIVDQRHATAVAATLRAIVFERQGASAAAARLKLHVEALGGLLSAELLHQRVGKALDALTTAEPSVRRRWLVKRPRPPRGHNRSAARVLQQLRRELRLLRAGLTETIEQRLSRPEEED